MIASPNHIDMERLLPSAGDATNDDDEEDGLWVSANAMSTDQRQGDVGGIVMPSPQPPTPDPSAHVAMVEERDGIGDHEGHVRLEPITFTLASAAAVAAIGGVLFGYDIGIISGALLQLRDDFDLDDDESEAVVGSLMAGALIGSATGGYLCDGIGRRNVIVCNAFLFIVAALWLACSTSLAMLIAARVLVGYAVSLSAIAECVYISEIAPASRRGQLVSLNELGITFGILAAFCVNTALIEMRSGWRLMFGLAAIPAAIQMMWMSRLPQSPRWLLMRGRRKEALAALQQFRFADPALDEIEMVPLMDLVPPGCDDDGDDDSKYKRGCGGGGSRSGGGGGAVGHGAPPRVVAELDAIAAAASAQGSTSFMDLVRVPVLRKALAIGCTLVLLQQLTGQPSLLLYGTVLLRQAGFRSGRDASLANLGIGLLKALSTVGSMLLVDRYGRRRLLLVGTFMMVLSLIVLACVLIEYPPDDGSSHNGTVVTNGVDDVVHSRRKGANGSDGGGGGGGDQYDDRHVPDEVKWTTLGSLAAYVCAFSFSYGPVVWLVLAETFPDDIRARAMAVATLVNNGANLAVSGSFLSLLGAVGIGGVCIIYASIGVVGGLFIATRLPETKGASLEEVQAILQRSKGVCVPCCNGSPSATASHRGHYAPVDMHGHDRDG